ncbi:uncharacterized protein LOC144606374 [Rhinoraja longicauda]
MTLFFARTQQQSPCIVLTGKGAHTTSSTSNDGSPAPTYGLIPPGYAQATAPYPTPPPKNGMYGNGMHGNVTNYPPYPQGPPSIQSPPYPTPTQFPGNPPAYSSYSSVELPGNPPAYSPYSSVGIAMPNPIAPPPIMPAYVNQQFLTSRMVTQQRLLVLQMPNQQVSTSTMVMAHSNRGVPASIMCSGYQPTAVYQKSSNSLTKEIASAVLTKVVQHALKPKPKTKGKQVTVINAPGGVVIHR